MRVEDDALLMLHCYWLHWEPPRNGQPSPHDGWCAWTADLWVGNMYHYPHLGWVHPHGHAIDFDSAMEEWLAFWRNNNP